MLILQQTASGVAFTVRVQPRASRNEICGVHDGALKIRLTAPPVDDRANDALCRFLASRLNLSTSAVKILTGAHSRTKRVEVRGLTAAQVSSLLELPAQPEAPIKSRRPKN